MPKATDVVAEVADEVKDSLEETIKEFSLASILPQVLLKLGLPAPLGDLLWHVIPGERKMDVRKAFQRQLGQRITTQEGRNGGELFARALVKQIDAHYETNVVGLTMEERHTIVCALVHNTARHLVLVADALLQYPEVARDVNVCKEKVDVRGLANARMKRTGLYEDIKRGFANSIRALVGDENLG